MNSMSKSAKVTDHFRASRQGAAPPVTRSKNAASAAAAAPAALPAAAAASSAADQDAVDEAFLRQFDLDSRFGPCRGITRLQRYERAVQLGLAPPPQVKEVIERHGEDSEFNKDLWSHAF